MLENKENNQNIEASFGAGCFLPDFCQPLHSEQVELLQLLGDGFIPQPEGLRAGERKEVEETPDGNI